MLSAPTCLPTYRTEARKQNDEFLSELGIEPNVGQALSDRHGFVGVGLKGDANA